MRAAAPGDADAMCSLLNRIIAIGGSTAHLQGFDRDRMIGHYICPPLKIACTLVEDGKGLAGFQALEWCDPDWPGPGKLPPDWAVIASFVAVDRQGQGIGGMLWPHTLAAARVAGVRAIDATIRADNRAGLRYYSSLGFVDHDRLAAIPLSDGTPVDRARKSYRLA